MPTPMRRAWRRFQEAPMLLSICGLAVAQTIVALVAEWSRLPVLTLSLYLFLGIGGAVACVGRLRELASTESAGLALILGAYTVIAYRQLIRITEWEQLAGGVLSFVALSLGFGIRLYVVRQAVKARKQATRELGDRQ